MQPSVDIMIGDVFGQLGELPDCSVHMAVTSPPYWGLRSYLPADSELKGYELGSEPTPERWAERQVKVFREVRRVLRDDGTCWVNVGDSYATNGGAGGAMAATGLGSPRKAALPRPEAGDPSMARWKRDWGNYKTGDRICQGYMLAEALRRDGWYLRQTIIWAKGLAFNRYRDDTQVLLWDEPELLDTDAPGSVMPESTSGWRFARCQVKVANSARAKEGTQHVEAQRGANNPQAARDGATFADQSGRYRDCPGCSKCEGTLGPDGYVLRKGSWRTTSSYELLLHLAKSKDYYGDGDAVAEACKTSPAALLQRVRDAKAARSDEVASIDKFAASTPAYGATSRNLRSVWVIPTKSYQGSHYATYPEALVVPIIKSSTSEKGVCPKCGAPWARVLQVTGGKKGSWHDHNDDLGAGQSQSKHALPPQKRGTLSWHPTCTCGGKRCRKPIPATVLDPYAGSGTTLAVAVKAGRSAIGIDLDPRNERLMLRRLNGRPCRGAERITKTGQAIMEGCEDHDPLWTPDEERAKG